jgi:hypothetical protein
MHNLVIDQKMAEVFKLEKMVICNHCPVNLFCPHKLDYLTYGVTKQDLDNVTRNCPLRQMLNEYTDGWFTY